MIQIRGPIVAFFVSKFTGIPVTWDKENQRFDAHCTNEELKFQLISKENALLAVGITVTAVGGHFAFNHFRMRVGDVYAVGVHVNNATRAVLNRENAVANRGNTLVDRFRAFMELFTRENNMRA